MIKDPTVCTFYNEDKKTLTIAVKGGEKIAEIDRVIVEDWDSYEGRAFKADGEAAPIIKQFGK